MKGTDRVVLLSLAMVGLLAAFYFMILSPKRQEASKLGDDVTQLQASIDEQNQVAQFAEQARQDFPRYYSRLVVLGKAAPAEADSPSMLVQVSGIAGRTGVDFRGLTLGQASAGGSSSTSAPTTATASPTPASGTATTGTTGTATTGSSGTPASSASGTPAPPASGTPAPSASGTTSGSAPTGDSASGSSTSGGATSAPATEAAAATLPIGATVGPAGLPTLPYNLKFKGTFFDTANFMSGLDSLVRIRKGQVAASGRLFTVDGFVLSDPTLGAVPKLQVDFAVTSYVVPPDEGLTAGAAPGGPAPSPTQPNVTPVADQ